MVNWHRETAKTIRPGSTVQEQLQSTGLDWNVTLSPVFYGEDKEHKAPVFAAYRSDNGMFLDIYSKRKPWQNEEIIGAFNRFCDQADLPMTHLGSLENGRMLYAAAKLPEAIAPAQAVGDLTECYLLLEDSHLNGRGLTVSIYANRLVCTNGMKREVKTGQRVISHVRKFNPERIEKILEATHTTLETEQRQMTQLAGTNIDQAEAAMQLITAFGDPSKAIHEQPRIIQTCMRLFGGQGKGASEISAYNTAYGLLHAVTEYYNHHATKRGTAAQQFQSILNGNRANQMQRFERQLVGCYLS